jgi:hypothetical protein
MITADGVYYLSDGVKTSYAGDIMCLPRIVDADLNTLVDVQVIGTGSADTGAAIGGIFLTFDVPHISAFTGSGTEDIEKYYNQVEQAVAGYLGGLTANGAITFTIV